MLYVIICHNVPVCFQEAILFKVASTQTDKMRDIWTTTPCVHRKQEACLSSAQIGLHLGNSTAHEILHAHDVALYIY